MKKKSLIIILLLAVVVLGGGYWLVSSQLITAPSFVTSLLPGSDRIAAPSLDSERAATATISATEGGKIRVLDDAGVVMTITIPKDSLAADTEITVTPFHYSTTSPMTHGVTISPADLVLRTPATLSFDWNMITDLAGKKSTISKRPDVVLYDETTGMVTLAAISPATLAPNYVPVTITNAGSYGVSVDTETITNAALATLEAEKQTLSQLAASITLANQDAHTSKTTAQAAALRDQVLEQAEPSLYELELAVILDEKLKQPISLINRAVAYGLTDGYLQLRCNQDFTTYEEALIGATVAQRLGYDEVFETCRARAEKILMAMAEEVVADKTRPIIDVIEIKTQMELLGLDDSGRGKVLAESMTNDIVATQEALNRQAGGDKGDDQGGTARNLGRSRPPLTGNDTNLPAELFAIQFLPLLGINAYDEESWKQFGDNGSNMMNNMVMAGREMCPALRQLAAEMGMPLPPEFEENCGKIESDKMLEGIEVWEREVDEYAEGVTDVQNNQTPDSSMTEMSELEAFNEWLEN